MGSWDELDLPWGLMGSWAESGSAHNAQLQLSLANLYTGDVQGVLPPLVWASPAQP